jgi:hypothetical protein
MTACPTCLAPLADAAAGCARCRAAAGSPIMLTVALTPESGPGVARFDSRDHAPFGDAGLPCHTPHPDRLLPPGVVPPPSGERTLSTRPPVPSVHPAEPPRSAETKPAVQPAIAVRLRVIRGLRVNAEYPVYPGRNVVGRFADKPVDIDLTGVEPDGQIWSSRRHAALTLDRGLLVVEDLNSLNGTWVNGTRLRAGAALPLRAGDVIQIGVCQLAVEITPA